MGKNSRQRHADKQRRAAERRRRQESQQGDPQQSGPRAAPGAATGRTNPHDRPTSSDDAAERLAAGCAQIERTLCLALRDRLWKHGWQPEELMRQIRRSSATTSASVELLATAIIADAIHHDEVDNEVHPSWRSQNGRIWDQASHDPDRDGWVGRWLAAAGAVVGEAAAVSTARALLGELMSLPPLPILIPPPGSPVSPDYLVADLVDTDAEPNPIFARIRALLAKAESTEFPAEAEVFTAKAQALMSDARIDEAAVRANSGERSASRVSATRIGIDEPYIASKQSLLHVVCEANDVRCVFSRGVDLATVVGPVGQLAYVELLFTSLLIQVQAALSADAATAPAGSRTRSRRYRSSFIVGFAGRIGERLQAARTASFASAGADALPVLAADDQATAELFDRLVGRTTAMRSSAKYDSLGVQAGVSAADRASLRDAGLEGSPGRGARGLPRAG
jgi:hypothetical protein